MTSMSYDVLVVASMSYDVLVMVSMLHDMEVRGQGYLWMQTGNLRGSSFCFPFLIKFSDSGFIFSESMIN